jgi:hypothetical protein
MSNKEIFIKSLTDKISDNMSRVKFGEITLKLKIHESRVVSISQEITEKTIQKQEVN